MFIKNKPYDMTLWLIRNESDNEGTTGVLYTGGYPHGFSCFTIELPWKDNKPFVSCIPNGTYFAEVDENTKFGEVPVIRFIDGQKALDGRYGILIHVANWAGDKKFGYRSDVEGCIGAGFGKDELLGQKAVTDSISAMTELIATTRNKKLKIIIQTLENWKDTNA